MQVPADIFCTHTADINHITLPLPIHRSAGCRPTNRQMLKAITWLAIVHCISQEWHQMQACCTPCIDSSDVKVSGESNFMQSSLAKNANADTSKWDMLQCRHPCFIFFCHRCTYALNATRHHMQISCSMHCCRASHHPSMQPYISMELVQKA